MFLTISLEENIWIYHRQMDGMNCLLKLYVMNTSFKVVKILGQSVHPTSCNHMFVVVVCLISMSVVHVDNISHFELLICFWQIKKLVVFWCAMLTGHCVMGSYAESIQLPFNDFCQEYRSAEEEETILQFHWQCPSLGWCKYRLFGSPFLVSLVELSSFNIKYIASFIKLSGLLSSLG